MRDHVRVKQGLNATGSTNNANANNANDEEHAFNTNAFLGRGSNVEEKETASQANQAGAINDRSENSSKEVPSPM